MILNFETYCLNEASLKTLKKTLHGVLGSKDRAKMKKLLRHHIVFFKFKKKNGELRRAVGTLISSFLPPLRGGAPKPEHQMVYYDLEKEHWRSFRSFSFIKILDLKTKEEYEGKKPKKIVKKSDDEEKEKKHHDEEEHVPTKHDEHVEKEEKESKSEHEDIKKKEFKAGDKIPENELLRRSSDFRKDSRKNKFTKKANDAKKKGELDDEEDSKKEKDEKED